MGLLFCSRPTGLALGRQMALWIAECNGSHGRNQAGASAGRLLFLIVLAGNPKASLPYVWLFSEGCLTSFY